jgi:hypothetical protein
VSPFNADFSLASLRRKGATPVVTQVSSARSLPGAWPEPTKRIVSLPLSRSNRPTGVLVVGINSRLLLDDPYTHFLRLYPRKSRLCDRALRDHLTQF